MTTSPRTGFTDLVAAQAIPEVTVNEMGRRIEQGAGHFIFKDRDLATPPGSPADGDCYLVAGSPTGAWTGHTGDIAFYMNTAWEFIEVIEGYTAWINDENLLVGYNGASWATLSSGGNPTESIIIACSDETTAITTGTAKVTFRMPYAFTLAEVRASVTTAPTGAAIIIDINENTGGGATTILSTKITIDATEKTSETAATSVISDTSLADDSEITIDFDQVGSTISGAGVKVYLIGSRT